MAVFLPRLPSLLQFDHKSRDNADDPAVAFNLRTLRTKMASVQAFVLTYSVLDRCVW
ncbi:MAG: hypothetical protein OXC82_12085 [Rhodobacteraceae bacterium]|nr:hypothetical protein [Paracoccaceae bacterium]MCY4251157.1 hypothetical protein [Paracoccaceae bacterium]